MDKSGSAKKDAPTSARTYVAGEDAGRLVSSARYLGLHQHQQDGSSSVRLRRPLRPVRDAVSRLLFDYSTATLAARMHSVGALGQDERVDAGGTLHHIISVRQRRKDGSKPAYGALEDLFQKQEQEAITTVAGEEGDDEEEEVLKDTVEGGSLNAAIFGIIKGTVGPAILYLPHGFQACGYAVAIPAMFFATFTYIFNAHRLLECWKVESDLNHQIAARMEHVRSRLFVPPAAESTHLDPSSLQHHHHQQQQAVYTPALLSYPELARRAFGRYSLVVELGIALMQFGVCLTYLIFCPQNLRECTLALLGVDVPKTDFLVAMVLIEIPLSWIRDIRKLTPTNVVATVLIAYGLCSVLILAFVRGMSHDEDGLVFRHNLALVPALTSTWFVFVGTSFFMMEGSITLLVPLQEAVFHDDDKAKFPRINQLVTCWIVVFYIIFSIVCVAAFGDGIRTALTASLTGVLASSVQLAYSIAVILTFPLQAYPAMEVVSKAVFTKKREDGEGVTGLLTGRNLLSTTLTFLMGLIAFCAIDYLGNVVSILGSLFGIPLALVFPPLMHNVLVKKASKATRMVNYCVVGVGFLAMGAASYATLASWNAGAEEG